MEARLPSSLLLACISIAFTAGEAFICLGNESEEISRRNCKYTFLDFDDFKESEIYIMGNVQFEITSRINLSSTLVFSGKDSVSLVGYGAEVYCKGSNSGLVFRNSTNIQIHGLTFNNCGSRQESTSTDFTNASRTLQLKCALYFICCTNVSINTVNVENSDGTGLVMYDSDGLVNITKCNFTKNAIKSESLPYYAGGGGVHIDITSCPVGTMCDDWHGFADEFKTGTIYIFAECHFIGNNASTLHEELSSIVSGPFVKQRLGRGGGLFISLACFSSNMTVIVSDSFFSENLAVWGGGMFVAIRNSAKDNTVNLTDCMFLRNKAKRGDGGLSISFSFKMNEIRNNWIEVNDNHFIGNSAPSGGGVGFYSSGKTVGNLGNTAMFTKCHWESNEAYYGAGLELQSEKAFNENKGSVILDSCEFHHNTVSRSKDFISEQSKSFRRAVISIAMEYMDFSGTTVLANNTGTAMQAMFSVVKLDAYGQLLFINNSGVRGGAIALLALSRLLVHNHTELHFENNIAEYYGGAIYTENFNFMDPYLFSDTKCSVQCQVFSEHGCNSSFVFVNNVAGYNHDVSFGNSVYFGSVESCVFICTKNESAPNTIRNIFRCIGHMEGNTETDKMSDFVSSDRKFEVKQSEVFDGSVLRVVPGKEFELPVMTLDAFDNSVLSLYYATFKHKNETSRLKIDPAYATVSSAVPRLLIYGDPYDHGSLELKSSGHFQYKRDIKTEMLPCPPGYSIIDQSIETSAGDNKKNVRICSCYNNSRNFYLGVLCRNDFDGFMASLRYGYWAGYVVNGSLSTSTDQEMSMHFYTAVCPLEYCQYNCRNTSEQNCSLSLELPSTSVPGCVDWLVCDKKRTGILCGSCREGFSVFYHTLRYDCFPDKLCGFGFLFYILSELVPVTIVFLFIIIFNVSFTTGAVNGFVFFAQTIDSLLINGDYGRDAYLNGRKTWAFQVHQVFYRFFNLDFFGVNSLSFCLWKGASTLDVSSFKYVTVIYSFLLVAFTIVILNKCRITKYLPYRLIGKGNYVIQGLTAFLILCYAQCVLVSFQLLFSIYLQGIDYKPGDNLHVYYSGDVVFFSRRHLPYAIPALTCLVTFVLMPPLILLWHPLAKQVLANCRLSESHFVMLIDRILMVNKLKPVIDSFQSSFRDSCRCFAGLYFIYRVILLLGLLVIKQSQLYVLVSIFLLIMLLFHSIMQPFKKRWHNVINGYFLANMLAINVISLSINHSLLSSSGDQTMESFIRVIMGIQEVLIYTPMAFILIYAAGHIINSRRVKFFNKHRNTDIELSLRSDDTNSLTLSEYSTMRDDNDKY